MSTLFFKHSFVIRILIVSMALFVAPRMFGVGWTPTDAGLVVNLGQGERFLLSVWIDKNGNGKEEPDEEFFVSNYNRYSGGYFGYSAGSFMKLLPATEITEMNEWSVGAPLARGNKALGGITYTIWNDGKTLKTSDTFKFLGDLTSDYNDSKACDVVFVVPTERGVPTVQGRSGLSSFDPNGTLGRGKAPFNGATGTGFLGMTYREVYMLQIPKANSPQSYTNSGLVTFNTTLSTWILTSGAGNIAKGRAAYAYADSKHDKTPRTIFRLYLLDNPINSCSSYFFATDEQDDVRYRMNENNPQKSSDSTAIKRIYTMDRLMCMSRDGSTKCYQTDLMRVPEPDNTYYYVGYDNTYEDDAGESMGTNGAHSLFTNIRELPMKDLSGFKAPAGAYGQMVVDTTSAADNLGVSFEPVGYFLKIKETGKNIRLHKTGDNTWTCEEMWTISGYYASLHIRTMLMTGSEFREDDEGAPVEGWSKWVRGDSVPTSDGKSIVDKSGYAQITINNTDSNGHMVFILGDNTKWIRYDNNGFMGLEMPLQYPLSGENKVTIMAPRIKPEYTFLGWTKNADGSGDTLKVGDEFTFTEAGEVKLYAQARYDGTLQMAISFLQGGKRYFLTHPGREAPRYARARHFDYWENTWQGMENAENEDPNYLSTYELRYPIAEIKRKDGDIPDLDIKEHVLDPRQYTMKGYTDSLTFYENFTPAKDEYIGLYYEEAFNTILANNTWAGLFTTTSKATELSWPNYKVPYITGVKIKSERYVEEYDPVNLPDSLILKVRANRDKSYVKYDPATDQFNGQADSASATTFDVSAVFVADEHYIILPDTTHEWRDSLLFDFHQNEQSHRDVWSALIGKQLMAVMIIDGDTVYFHPNRNKIINDPNNLYLSSDFRMTQTFELIRDSRVSGSISAGDSARVESTDHYWHYDIVSGYTSPINVRDRSGNYIDVVDTFRITLSHGDISKVKEYRGRWNGNAAGLKMNKDGSRYRDVIVHTKAYHYGDVQTRTVLKAEKERYSFGPLKGQTQQINFLLTRETYQQMLDKDDNEEGEIILSVDTLTSGWKMKTGGCRFASGIETYYTVASAVGSQVTLNVEKENSSGVNYDTLVISTILVNEVDSVLTVPVRVPLVQAALEGDELIWSAVYNKQRYYLVASSGGLIARKYNLRDNTLYKDGTTTHLLRGMANEENRDKQYITPWKYDYHPVAKKQTDTLTLYTKLSDGTTKYFRITGEGESARGVLDATGSLLIYKYVNVYSNDNANFEEQVRLRYGSDGWLKLTGASAEGTPTITLTTTESEGTIFSWGYLHDEYSLLNNGTYPSQESVEFGYNRVAPASVQTLYKARHEYSMLVDNTMTYLCRREQTRIDSLTSASREWKTQYRIDTIRDHRVATLSALNNTTVGSTMTTTITPVGTSPMNVTYGGEYVNIVDTLRVTLSLQEGAPAYRFKEGWSKFTKISDANLKIPLIRRTYHEEPYNGVECSVEGDKDVYTFPATIVASGTGKNDTHTFTFYTTNNVGTQVVNVYGEVAATRRTSSVDLTGSMNLTNRSLAQVSLADEKGNTPSWCVLSDTTANTVTVKCLESGIRSSRIAYLYLAYIVTIDAVPHFVNFRITISQQSLFEYANNQHLVHSNGVSGDDLRPDGMQQVHENKRILYYYPEQDVELPVRERAFYGWWRWYREGKGDIGDSDVPDSLWRVFPRNIGKYNFPYRIIGDSVDDGAGGKKLVTMGRYTVFHYPSKDYGNKNDPPSKSARVAPPITTFGAARKDTVTYAVDMSNYYDHLPMSLTNKNNVDIEMMDTMTAIIEPTLSIREVFELHPWTEMAEKLEGYKYADGTANGSGTYSRPYMEEHEVMAPIGNRLLLRTEQRYNYENLTKHGHSESLLGYYMRDDNWSDPGWNAERKDTMIWCGGWDADCQWFSYNTMTKTYAPCTHDISTEEDFLIVPARTSISEGHQFDTIYYFLRARSKATTGTPKVDETTDDGGNWFNICRYMIIYHQKDLYGPKEETAPKGEVKALITNDEIEQNYEVLERLNFDYNKPGTGYTIYPHPLPWADASYGYTYPETSDLPHNRYHDQSDFPNHGEYGLINRIPYDQYWRKMEQHGGAANGYMIYCDGMSSAGQVAALSLHKKLCEGQSMYFSGYVGNPSSQTGKSDPNFIFSVQGSVDGSTWEDITSYMTGDIKPSNNWYQIYFPINHNRKGGKTEYSHFRVQIFNVASSFDGNDFVIDDMCIFATKPPLLAFQANTRCVEDSRNDSTTQVVLRLDYKGFTDKKYNNANVYYTVVQSKAGSTDTTFVKMDDGYLHEATIAGTPDTIYGYIEVPEAGYMPIVGTDSIYPNMDTLVARFEANAAHKTGYIYETLDGVSRPVLYVIHQAKMAANQKYNVHMALSYSDMLGSICAMTSDLKVTNRMMLELNGEEQQNREENVCPNSTYTLSMRVKGTQYVEGAAPLDLTGSCVNDWLLYGDTAEASSYTRYGHYYSDIVKVVKDILRANDPSNTNQFANNLSDVNRNVMIRMQGKMTLKQDIAAYDLLADMVGKGYLTLYKKEINATVMAGDVLEYVVFPIVGSGSKAMQDAGLEVCPQPIHIKLTPSGSTPAPIVIGGINRDETQLSQPLVLLANEQNANKQITIHIDDIQADRAIHSVSLLSTDDPNFLEGSHTLNLLPNKVYGEGAYYTRGDDILLRPASASTYHMRPGYNYTFIITMQTSVGATTLDGGCPVGTIPFTVSVVPDYLRWDPKNNESNRWNNPGNWVGVSDANEKIHDNAHFAPLATSNVIIPTLDPGLPYPEVPNLADKASYDSIKQVGFEYNQCNVIRFMSGAAMGQQQRMNYNRAVVDLSTPHEKWALRAAPVTGMLSGDIFMANDDLSDVTSPWEVGYFDAEGRNKNTGNASFWLSVYNTATVDKGNGHDVKDSARTAAAEWSKVTNGMTLSLPPASGWAVFTRTKSKKDAAIRLPKNDDLYYYYNHDGEKMDDIYEHNLQYMRDTCAGEVGGSGKAGKLAFDPDGASQTYTLKNGVASTMFVFGNPTMGYIDIWGFIADNAGLSNEFDYINSEGTGSYVTVTKDIADLTADTITEQKRYLPPMHAIVLKATAAATSKTVTLNTSRVVTVSALDRAAAPARHMSATGRRQGIMTVTAINPLTSACKSRLLIGQGYHNAVRDGEDAMLTTININEYNSSAPSTLFNIYASEGEYGLCIDLLDEVVNVPVSFCNMSGVPFEPVTELWFTGVYNIDGELVFYDALTGSEQTILDGLCIKIPTPEQNHETRYYIRRRGYDPNDPGSSITTSIDQSSHFEMDGATAVKIIQDGHVLILRDGHVYTMFGQKLR